MIAAATSLGWLVGVLVPVFLLLFAVIGWFARRELGAKEKEIKALESELKERFPSIQQALYGHQPERGARVPGILERLEDLEEEVEKSKASIESYMHKEIEALSTRVGQSERWLQDEGEKTRKVIAELQKSVSHLTGEISTLLQMMKSH